MDLIQARRFLKGRPDHIVEAIETLGTLYGRERICFDLETKPFKLPTLVAYYIEGGAEKRLGPVI